jgi:hypothetical protein
MKFFIIIFPEMIYFNDLTVRTIGQNGVMGLLLPLDMAHNQRDFHLFWTVPILSLVLGIRSGKNGLMYH